MLVNLLIGLGVGFFYLENSIKKRVKYYYLFYHIFDLVKSTYPTVSYNYEWFPGVFLLFKFFFFLVFRYYSSLAILMIDYKISRLIYAIISSLFDTEVLCAKGLNNINYNQIFTKWIHNDNFIFNITLDNLIISLYFSFH